MHIVLDGRFLRRSTSGIGRYTQSLICELAKIRTDEHFTVLLTPADVDDWRILVREADLNPAIWRSHVADIPHFSLAEQLKLPTVLRSLAPDLVHFLNFNHPLRYTGRFVVTIHDLTMVRYPAPGRQRSPVYQWAFRWVLHHAVRQADRVIVDSAATKQDIVNVLDGEPDRIVTVHLGVDPVYQPVNLPQRGRIQTFLNSRYGIRPPYLLFVSQWRPHKGIDILLEAYRLLRESVSSLTPRLVLVGKPHPDFPEIANLIERHPYRTDIIRPGFVDEADLPKFYQGAELFLCPSIYEGFGLPPLEAMASGTPVIATNTSSLPEVVGDAARLVPPSDASALARAIEELLKDHRRLSDLRSRGLVQARLFSWQRCAQETLAVYHAAKAGKS